MAKKKKSRTISNIMSQNKFPESPYLKLKAQDTEGWPTPVPLNAQMFTVGGNECIAFFIPGNPEEREKIFLQGFNRYPTWHEMSSAAQLFKSGTMWVAAPEPNRPFMVCLLDFHGMVDGNMYEMVTHFLASITMQGGNRFELLWSDVKVAQTYLDQPGVEMMISTNADDKSFLVEIKEADNAPQV